MFRSISCKDFGGLVTAAFTEGRYVVIVAEIELSTTRSCAVEKLATLKWLEHPAHSHHGLKSLMG